MGGVRICSVICDDSFFYSVDTRFPSFHTVLIIIIGGGGGGEEGFEWQYVVSNGIRKGDLLKHQSFQQSTTFTTATNTASEN